MVVIIPPRPPPDPDPGPGPTRYQHLALRSNVLQLHEDLKEFVRMGSQGNPIAEGEPAWHDAWAALAQALEDAEANREWFELEDSAAIQSYTSRRSGVLSRWAQSGTGSPTRPRAASWRTLTMTTSTFLPTSATGVASIGLFMLCVCDHKAAYADHSTERTPPPLPREVAGPEKPLVSVLAPTTSDRHWAHASRQSLSVLRPSELAKQRAGGARLRLESVAIFHEPLRSAGRPDPTAYQPSQSSL